MIRYVRLGSWLWIFFLTRMRNTGKIYKICLVTKI